MNQPPALPETKRECSIHLREAKREVRELVAASYLYQQRDRERKCKLQQFEISGGDKANNHVRLLRRLQQAEEIKAMIAKIRTARTRDQRKGVTSIEIAVHPESDPKTWTDWKVIDVPSEVVEHLQRRNRAHFGQAHGTPFTIPPLSTDLVSVAICKVRKTYSAGDTMILPSSRRAYGSLSNISNRSTRLLRIRLILLSVRRNSLVSLKCGTKT